MIKTAIDRILSIGEAYERTINGVVYTDTPSHRAVNRLVPPEHHHPDTIQTYTLDSIPDYISKGDIPPKARLFLHVLDYNTVHLFGHMDPQNNNTRFCYLTAKLNAEQFTFGHWYPLEEFIIALQSQFIPDEQIDALIDMLGNLANEHIVENKDDGFSQSLQIKTGIHTKSKVTIKNPLTLRPYRTFREIEQPASQVVFRLKNNNGMFCSLHIADGGQWKLEAVKNIAAYLRAKLEGKVPVIE